MKDILLNDIEQLNARHTLMLEEEYKKDNDINLSDEVKERIWNNISKLL